MTSHISVLRTFRFFTFLSDGSGPEVVLTPSRRKHLVFYRWWWCHSFAGGPTSGETHELNTSPGGSDSWRNITRVVFLLAGWAYLPRLQLFHGSSGPWTTANTGLLQRSEHSRRTWSWTWETERTSDTFEPSSSFTQRRFHKHLYLKKSLPQSHRCCSQPQKSRSIIYRQTEHESEKQQVKKGNLVSLVTSNHHRGGGGVGAPQLSVLEASLGLDVVEDLLQLLVLKAPLQAETHKTNFIDSAATSMNRPTNSAWSSSETTNSCSSCLQPVCPAFPPAAGSGLTDPPEQNQDQQQVHTVDDLQKLSPDQLHVDRKVSDVPPRWVKIHITAVLYSFYHLYF